jgi:hypothetical protein
MTSCHLHGFVGNITYPCNLHSVKPERRVPCHLKGRHYGEATKFADMHVCLASVAKAPDVVAFTGGEAVPRDIADDMCL